MSVLGAFSLYDAFEFVKLDSVFPSVLVFLLIIVLHVVVSHGLVFHSFHFYLALHVFELHVARMLLTDGW